MDGKRAAPPPGISSETGAFGISTLGTSKAACLLVKFDTEQLPPILNALETDNGGQKLVLEVAVSRAQPTPYLGR